MARGRGESSQVGAAGPFCHTSVSSPGSRVTVQSYSMLPLILLATLVGKFLLLSFRNSLE